MKIFQIFGSVLSRSLDATDTVVADTAPPTPLEMTLKSAYRQEGFEFIQKLISNNDSIHHHKRASFKHKYVGLGGRIQGTRGSGSWLDIEATTSVSESAHQRAASIASRMTMYMSSSIFSTLARNAKVGVFTRADTLTVFPEYYSLRDTTACRGSCSGSCAHTCTFDGRKYASLAGTGGAVGCIVDDNILCDSNDPYRHQANMLVHEFAHTVKLYGIPSSIKSQITAAYNHARSNRIWDLSVYAMSTEEEYWAESSQVYFNVEKLTYTTGGMNTCGHSGFCTNEQDSRYYLYTKDVQLYNALTTVYTNNHPERHSNLATCM
ncbi:hypothetical protein KP79_PYT23697 [Mizuhopecten yessoensis]|uniref:Lysine-specific metallo-endopeptidase domain-containing protein n=1 Tax=Mizuhopecten yessoensis TaxID=6573 RepID=A0A210PQR8_MIZYE|nr:hypothetical protein KP79_PYT23697 [Mizuhopecten yessoensis]